MQKEKQKRFVNGRLSRWPEDSVGRQVEAQKIKSIAAKQAGPKLSATGVTIPNAVDADVNTTRRGSRTSSTPLQDAGRQLVSPTARDIPSRNYTEPKASSTQQSITLDSIPHLDSLGASDQSEALEICVLCNQRFPRQYYFDFHLDECLKQRRTLRPETVKSKNELVQCPYCRKSFPEFLALEHIRYCDHRQAQLRERNAYSRERQDVKTKQEEAQERLRAESRGLFATQQRLKRELQHASTAGDLHDVHRIGRELRDVERAFTAMTEEMHTQQTKRTREWSAWKQVCWRTLLQSLW